MFVKVQFEGDCVCVIDETKMEIQWSGSDTLDSKALKLKEIPTIVVGQTMKWNERTSVAKVVSIEVLKELPVVVDYSIVERRIDRAINVVDGEARKAAIADLVKNGGAFTAANKIGALTTTKNNGKTQIYVLAAEV